MSPIVYLPLPLEVWIGNIFLKSVSSNLPFIPCMILPDGMSFISIKRGRCAGRFETSNDDALRDNDPSLHNPSPEKVKQLSFQITAGGKQENRQLVHVSCRPTIGRGNFLLPFIYCISPLLYNVGTCLPSLSCLSSPPFSFHTRNAQLYVKIARKITHTFRGYADFAGRMWMTRVITQAWIQIKMLLRNANTDWLLMLCAQKRDRCGWLKFHPGRGPVQWPSMNHKSGAM